MWSKELSLINVLYNIYQSCIYLFTNFYFRSNITLGYDNIMLTMNLSKKYYYSETNEQCRPYKWKIYSPIKPFVRSKYCNFPKIEEW